MAIEKVTHTECVEEELTHYVTRDDRRFDDREKAETHELFLLQQLVDQKIEKRTFLELRVSVWYLADTQEHLDLLKEYLCFNYKKDYVKNYNWKLGCWYGKKRYPNSDDGVYELNDYFLSIVKLLQKIAENHE